MLQNWSRIRKLQVNYHTTKDRVASYFNDDAFLQLHAFLPDVLAIHIRTTKRTPQECLTHLHRRKFGQFLPYVTIYRYSLEGLNDYDAKLAYIHWTKDPVVLRSIDKYAVL